VPTLVLGGTECCGPSATQCHAAGAQPSYAQLPGLKVGTFNVRSANKKSATISDIIASLHLDILALQETWHENTDSLSIRSAAPHGYCIVETARPRDPKSSDKLQARVSVGGGVAIIHRAEFKAKRINSLPKLKTCEVVCCRMSTANNSDVIVLSLYRPGSKSLTTEFYTEFTTLLEALVTFRCPVFLVGDLNIHFERVSDVHVSDFIDLLSSFDMMQFVQEVTHKDGGLLDVIIARSNERVVDIVVSETGVSDHSVITGRLPFQSHSCEPVSVEGRKWNNFSIDSFRADLAASVLCNDGEWMKLVTVDELFNVYNAELTAILDRHAPRYVRKRKKRLITPWFDDSCRQMKRKVRVFERKYRKSRDPTDRLLWVTKLQEQARFYHEKERCYWSSRINANARDARRLWRDLDDLMKRDDSNNVSMTSSEAAQRAEDFLEFFDDKVESVRKETENASQPIYNVGSSPLKLNSFRHITQAEVVKLINSANNKYCILDPVPSDIVKKCSDLLSNFIAEMFNRSMDEGYLPQTQKVAHISPHLKKRGLDETDLKNYRPVSNLTFISKLLERFIAGQLNSYLLSTNAMPSSQSAYRHCHSTETALLKVFSDLCRAVDDGNICLLGLLDMTAAFDTVDHNILLKRMEVTFGITGKALEWFTSYLSDRFQSVSILGQCSKSIKLKHGVPQGSVLGPLLFLLYTAPIADIITQHGLLHHCYADDTQIYFYCPQNQLSTLTDKFANCINEVEQWMCSNRLKLNCNKTEVIWVASRYMLKTANSFPPVKIGSTIVQPADVVRNLGCHFDSQLNMRQHINTICRSCYFQLRQLRVIRRSLPRDVLKTLLHAFVASRLDYCNSLFYGITKYDLRKVQAVQNAAARLFGGIRKFDHITPVLRDSLHWLPIKQRIEFKIAVLTYKSLHQMAPQYLAEMCQPVSHAPYLVSHRSASHHELLHHTWKTYTYGQRGFDYAAPTVWNSLPITIRLRESLMTFRRDLKTYLFKEAYN